MIHFFKRLKIRAKLLLAFGSIILLSVLLTIFSTRSTAKIIASKNLKESSDKLSMQLQQMELLAKDFLHEGYKDKTFQETGKNQLTKDFFTTAQSIQQTISTIQTSHVIEDGASKKMSDSLRESTTRLMTHFENVKKLLKERGFKDFGLEGSLREAIHKVEKSPLEYDRTTMLMLRRHEKDFFLRKDLKYVNEFEKTLTAFKEALEASGTSELIFLLNNYEEQFKKVVSIEQTIGLTAEEGEKGLLSRELHGIQENISEFQRGIHEITEAQIEHTNRMLFLIFFTQLVAAITLAIVYANVLTAVIKEIRTTMRQLAGGIFPPSLVVRTAEEIGETKTAINQFLERLKVATVFAEKLGSGELKATYDERYNNDVLAKAIITMQQRLSESESVQAKINWTNEGAAQFNDIVKNEAENIDVIGERILKMLINYLEMNQGVLYIINNEQRCFERVATYAYGKKKFIEEKVDLEHGLLGQCVQERETIYLKEIPNDYVKITSGLGEATPKNVVIVPLKIQKEVMGVLELASFELLEEYKIQFLEKIAESVAAILHNRQVARQTRLLLEESRRRENELIQQEEGMRQNAEELQATQEAMERQRKELEQEIRELKKHVEHDYINS